MELDSRPFGKTKDGKEVVRFTAVNSRGLAFSAIGFGAVLTAVTAPDRRGRAAGVTLGLDSLAGYEARGPYFGALVGRVANRIARGRFTLDGREHRLALNDHGVNHLHGGETGYDRVLWQAEGFQGAGEAGVKLSYLSRDGEEGYPGNLRITATYTLNERDELAFECWAETDRATPVSLANHAYWNLCGAGSGDILAHELELACPCYLPVDEGLIPTGEVRAVHGTLFDFIKPKPIGRDLARVPGGYDHCFAAASRGPELKLLARLRDPQTGRRMEVSSTQPAVQLYIGSFLDGVAGAGGAVYHRYGGVCLETQHYPDAVNHPNFPSCILRPWQLYHHKTVHRFFAE